MSSKIQISKFFETKTRDSGETFVTMTDNIPQWLYDAVQEAHCGDFPDDWTYAECRDACAAIDEETLTSDDDLHEHCDSAVEIYTVKLARWYADHCLGSLYSEAESRAEDFGTFEGKDLSVNKILTTIQYCAIEIVAGTILRAWQAHNEDMGDDEQESADDAADRLMRANEARRAKEQG